MRTKKRKIIEPITRFIQEIVYTDSSISVISVYKKLQQFSGPYQPHNCIYHFKSMALHSEDDKNNSNTS